MTLHGWRAHGVAFLAGAAASFAMPPWYGLPLAVVGIVIYVLLWDSAPTWRAAFWRALAWGTGHFAVGSYWILEAFWVPPADFKLIGPPIMLGLAVVLGFFPGLAAGLAYWLRTRLPKLGVGWQRLVLLAVLWTTAEWLRGHVFTGYPSNPLGHVWAFASPLLQSAALFGVFGLSALTFLALGAPAAGWRASIGSLVAVAVTGGVGVLVMEPSGSTETRVRVVQPSISQAEKWQRGREQAQLAKLINLTRREGFDRVNVVVWPETAVPYIVQPNSPVLAALIAAVPPGGHLLTGSMRALDRVQDGVWNSLLVIDGKGQAVAHYDKVHLVPLGEYIPFHKHLGPVSGAVGRGSFEEGQSFVTLTVPGLPPFSPIICYEVIFPSAVTAPLGSSGTRPQWLVNITNDAWFGLSSGPYQHLTSARLRAIEEGLPMIRSANTGISAVIDAYGNVLESLDMQREGIIDRVLPPPRAATPYSKWGDATLAGLLLLLIIIAFTGARKARTTGVRLIR